MPIEMRNCFVACFDILGFRELVKQRNINELAEIYQAAVHETAGLPSRERAIKQITLRIVESFSATIAIPPEREETTVQEREFGNVDVFIFSDSMYLFSENDNQDNFTRFGWLCNEVFRLLLGMRLPVRGAIAQGQCALAIEQNVFVGQPIIDAFDLQESLDIIGLVVHPNIDTKSRDMIELSIHSKCTHKPQVKNCPHVTNMRVPVPREPDPRQFEDLKDAYVHMPHESNLDRRYQQSEHVVSMMITGTGDLFEK